MAKGRKKQPIREFFKQYVQWIDVVIGLIGGLFISTSAFFYFGDFASIMEIIEWVEPYINTVLNITVFTYCMNKAFSFQRPPFRTIAFKPKTWPEALSGNLMSVAWIIAGLIFVVGSETILALIK